MQITQTQVGAVTVLRPEGPLKGTAADEFQGRAAEVLKGSLGRCVVDASAIQFVDSRGLEVLAGLNDAMNQTGHALRLCGANETLRQVLELTDLAPQFEQYADVNAAVRSFL